MELSGGVVCKSSCRIEDHKRECKFRQRGGDQGRCIRTQRSGADMMPVGGFWALDGRDEILVEFTHAS